MNQLYFEAISKRHHQVYKYTSGFKHDFVPRTMIVSGEGIKFYRDLNTKGHPLMVVPLENVQ
jgi:hypothetical protein